MRQEYRPVLAGLVSPARKLKPSGCIFCDLKMEPVKLRRRWVHHIPKRGQLVPCEARNLKPQSAA